MLVTALILSMAAMPRASSSQDELAAVRGVLQRTEGSTSARDDVLVRRLVALGAGAAPGLFSLVTGEGVDALFGETGEEAWLCPQEHAGALALQALAQLPLVPVRDFLRAHCSEHPTRETRAAAFQVLGRQASPEGIELLMELCLASGDELQQRSLRAPAVEALSALLRLDDRTIKGFEASLLAAPLPLQHLACEALAASGRAESVRLLAKLLGRDAELDVVVTDGLSQLAERYPWALADDVAPRLRASLEKGKPALRAAAARALGRTRDAASIPSLIACVGEGDAATARAAQWALVEITGQKKPRTREEWAGWLEGERAWWKDQGLALISGFDDPDASTKLSASLRKLMAHPLGRDRVGEGLCAALDGFEPGAKVIACSALAALGARRAVPALVDLLVDPTPEVRQAAWAALRALTGAELPPEPQLWEEYAFG